MIEWLVMNKHITITCVAVVNSFHEHTLLTYLLSQIVIRERWLDAHKLMPHNEQDTPPV